MRKNLLLLPCMMSIITTIIAGILFVLDEGQQTNRSMISILLAGFWVFMGFICNIIYFINAKRNRYNVHFLAKTNIGLKILHLPLGIAFLAVGIFMGCYIISFLPDIFKDGWAFVIIVMLIMIIAGVAGVALVETVQSGLVSIVCVNRAKEEGLLDKKKAFRYRILSCVPVVDLLAAILIWKRIR